MFVDRFEKTPQGVVVVIEVDVGQFVEVALDDFVDVVHEGDAVYKGEDGKWHVDKEQTEQRRKVIEDLMDQLFTDED
ncbi:DUF3006 domain-containing protein [Coprothermobacteraceae bacterium]|nr:DUF3006 domain-containing protein [Coprothermobacteraceae bacterium]